MTLTKIKAISKLKIRAQKTKILLLCHGNKSAFNYYCPFPVSRKMMQHIVTLDIDSNRDPDVLENFTKKTKLEKESIDLTCGIFYPVHLIVSKNGTLRKNHFIPNIIKILKIGGYYVFTELPYYGLRDFCKFLRSTIGQCFLIHIRKMRIIKNILNLKLDIRDLSSDQKNDINKIFCLYIQYQFPNLKLLQTKKELDAYKNNFLTNFVCSNESLDEYDKKHGFDYEKSSHIFIKI